jgi:NTE family protein
VVREETPQTAREILNRVNEITFNASLLSEFRAIGYMRRLIEGGIVRRFTGKSGQRNLRLHRIAGTDELTDLTSSSKFNTEWNFLLHLRDLGRDAAGEFLSKNFPAIGRRATLDPVKELA